MNTPSRLPHLHTCTRVGRYILTLLVGTTLALSTLLPSVAFAHTQNQARTLASDPNYLVDKAGVSVVRLEVTYSNSNSTQLSGEITCSGLGILVGSSVLVTSPSNGPVFQNWVLANASLLNSRMTTCELANANTVGIQIFSNRSYSKDEFPPLAQISCFLGEHSFPTACHTEGLSYPQLSIPVGNQATLLSFQWPVALPYLSLASTPGVHSTVLGLGSLIPEAVVPPNIEPGAPLVNARGELEGMYQSDDTILPPSPIINAVTTVVNPANLNSVKAFWDQGMDAYNQGTQASCQQAHADFQEVTQLNANFGAASVFAARTQACASLAGLPQAVQSNVSPLPLIGLGVFLLLLMLSPGLLWRVNNRRRAFKIEYANVPSPTKVDLADAERTITAHACPHCGYLVKAGTIDCPNCGWRPVTVPNVPQKQTEPITEERFDSPIALPSQARAVESVTGDAYRETRLRKLWDRVGQ